MGFFNKILVQEKTTGNLIDIVNLDKDHYESFLEAMRLLQVAYSEAITKQQENNEILEMCKDEGLNEGLNE